MKRINQPVIALVAVGMFSAPAGAGFTVDHSNYRIYSQGNGATITATPIGDRPPFSALPGLRATPACPMILLAAGRVRPRKPPHLAICPALPPPALLSKKTRVLETRN